MIPEWFSPTLYVEASSLCTEYLIRQKDFFCSVVGDLDSYSCTSGQSIIYTKEKRVNKRDCECPMQHDDLLLRGCNALEAEERIKPHKSRTKSSPSPSIIEVFCYCAFFFISPRPLKWEGKFDPNSQAVSRQLNFARTCKEALRCYMLPCWKNLMDCTGMEVQEWQSAPSEGQEGKSSVIKETLNTDHQDVLLPPKEDDPDLESDGNPSHHHLEYCFHFCCMKLLLIHLARIMI